MKTCILTIIKDEQEYLDEFISYHLSIDIDHIFIVEDYGSSSHKEIIDKYPCNKLSLLSVLDFYETDEKKQRIIYEKTHLFKMQHNYLKNGLAYIKNNYNYDWCFVIDIDEYITIENKYKSLNEVLSIFTGYDAILIQWENYGANGLIYKPNYKEKKIIDTYTQKVGYQNEDNDMNNLKCVYNMNTYVNENYKNNHIPNLNIKWCKTNLSQDTESLIYDKIYLRHYITKSWEEYVCKLHIRGMFFKHHRNYDSFFEMNTDMIDKKEELIKLADDILEKHKK